MRLSTSNCFVNICWIFPRYSTCPEHRFPLFSFLLQIYRCHYRQHNGRSSHSLSLAPEKSKEIFMTKYCYMTWWPPVSQYYIQILQYIPKKIMNFSTSSCKQHRLGSLRSRNNVNEQRVRSTVESLFSHCFNKGRQNLHIPTAYFSP
jgi:hypothetical protein